MFHTRRTSSISGLLLFALGGAGCAGEGEWTMTTWGEAYIEEGIPASAFEDGCSATFDRFLVVLAERELRDGDATVVGSLEGAQVYDLALEGPHEMGAVPAPATHYDDVHVRLGPDAGATAGNVDAEVASTMAASGESVRVGGELTCGGTAVRFDWGFKTDTAYLCEPEDLTIPEGGSDATEFTVHGDHLFYDGLENADAAVRGSAIVDADADGDGSVTLEELGAVAVAPLGYDVGRYSEVTNLAEFVAFLTRTIGHVDGEGHCQVDL